MRSTASLLALIPMISGGFFFASLNASITPKAIASLAASTPSICGGGFTFNIALSRSAAAGRAYIPFLESTTFTSGNSFKRVLEAAQPGRRRGDRLRTFQHQHVALAAHRLEQRAGGLERDAVIVGADERNGGAAGQPVADIDQWNVRGVDLLHRRDHCLDVDRGEHDGVALGAQRLIDQRGLLRNVVGRGRDVVKHRDAVRLRHRLGAGAHRARDRIARALGEDRDGLGAGGQGADRDQARDRGSKPSTMVFHRLLPIGCGAGRSSSSPRLLIIPPAAALPAVSTDPAAGSPTK